MTNVQMVEVTYRVPVEVSNGMKLPNKPKSVTSWLPTRHGVVLNEYMRWCKEGRGSKQDFAKNLINEIAQGKHPILERNITDTEQRPFTVNSIMSQIDWWAQGENQVVTEKPESTFKQFHPNRLMVLTTEQKAAEARRSKAERGSQEEIQDCDLADPDFSSQVSEEDFVSVRMPKALAEAIAHYM